MRKAAYSVTEKDSAAFNREASRLRFEVLSSRYNSWLPEKTRLTGLTAPFKEAAANISSVSTTTALVN